MSQDIVLAVQMLRADKFSVAFIAKHLKITEEQVKQALKQK